MPRPRWLHLLALLSTSCISTQLVQIDNLAVPLPSPNPSAGWQAEAAALLDVYERSPVVAPEDERLDPLFGGLTSLTYFGVDVQARARDQQLSPGMAAPGEKLSTACAEELRPTADAPSFLPVWVPLSRMGAEPDPGVQCDPQGKPTGERAAESFCMFARLALRPERDRTLVMVVHGLFDSGAQAYVQRMAAALFEQGHSVLVPDMRDHGDTLRAAPELATTLGTLEGHDLLALARAMKQSCAGRFSRIGVAAVSGGALDAIRAFTLDRDQLLSAGVIAISPLLDVRAAMRDLSQTGSCAATRALELTWFDDVLIAGVTGAAFFGGAALGQALAGEPLDGTTAAVAGIGAGAGLLTAVAVDAWFDGGSKACITDHALSLMLQDMLSVRWNALREARVLSPGGQRLQPGDLTIEAYMRERAQFQAKRMGVNMREFDARSLAKELRASLRSPERSQARLLVMSAEDDPMTRIAGLREFAELTRGLSQVYVRSLSRGGHAGMWIVQPTVMQALFGRFF